MAQPDIVVELPEGWVQLENEGGPLTYSPDDGDSVLQLSSPSWASELRGQDIASHAPVLREVVEGGKLGTVAAIGAVELGYGRALRAEIDSDDIEDARAWLVVPETHDVLLATWLADASAYGETAAELIASLRPGLFSAAIAAAVDIASKALANDELHEHAVLFGDGQITRVELGGLPQELWNEACRVERANVAAEVVVQVLPATARPAKGQAPPRDIALIYAESSTRERLLVVGDGAPRELEAERIDFFARPDPRVRAVLEAAGKRR